MTRRFGQWLAKENFLFGKLLGSSAAGILAIVLLGVIFVTSTHEKVPMDKLRTTALETLRSGSQIESDLDVMDTSVRDFLVSGDAPYRIQFDTARASLGSRIDALRGFVEKDSAETAMLKKVSDSLSLWVTSYARPQIEARVKGTSTTSLTPYSEGAVMMDTVRASLQQFRTLAAATLENANKRATMQIGGFTVLCALA